MLCPRCYEMDADMLRVGAKLASLKVEVVDDRVLASGPHRQPLTGDLHLQATEQVRLASTHCMTHASVVLTSGLLAAWQ